MDSAAFKSIILEHHRAMYRTAYAIVGNVGDAEDVVQETMLKMWNRRRLLADIDNHRAYCITAVKRQSIDFLRKHRPEVVDIEGDALQICDEESADSRLEKMDSRNSVGELLATLPENMRRVMILRTFSECSIEEIEKITGLSGGNIRTLLSRARKRIKEFIGNEKR